MVKATARVGGAVSIVNAIAGGKGAALGVALSTEATVELMEGTDDIAVTIENEPTEDTTLAREVVRLVLERHLPKKIGGRVRTISNIPIAKGLKSSSAAANAISLATVAALQEVLDDEEVVKVGVEASIRAGVSITGAYDDACASYFGGIVVTDNHARKILLREEVPEEIKILIFAPDSKIYTSSIDRGTVAKFSPLVDEAFALAQRREFWKALTMNGLIYSAALGQTTKPALEAMRAGALAAGLSGTGPAVAAVCGTESLETVRKVWSELSGTVIETVASNRRAEVRRG